ncbi:hypothetical protein [Xylocopilactobacillus apicola]|uniref:Uncharacterized protein n=1 Tax=Xylocopilactobacillus apicola TaxID=2932184 RepID=A0AAU9DPM2_9LACO|nr:hypothetical protein [Xylocopilactobacillus apicola]BDR57754.1 hypothetical protein XA3_01950 [Xylocopilactobacillus apicola]
MERIKDTLDYTKYIKIIDLISQSMREDLGEIEPEQFSLDLGRIIDGVKNDPWLEKRKNA